MALRSQTAMTRGELDPALHERVDLEAYRNGLATARNVIVGKTGRILTAPGRKFKFQTQDNAEARVIMLQQYGLFMVVQPTKYEVYTLEGTKIGGETFTIDLDNSNFVFVPDVGIFVISRGETWTIDLLQFDQSSIETLLTNSPAGFGNFGAAPDEVAFWSVGDPSFFNGNFSDTASLAISGIAGTGSPSGYDVQYAVTQIVDGQESDIKIFATSAKLPIATSERNLLTIGANTDATEVRVYRSPYDTGTSKASGAFGFIGSATVNTSGTFKFTDFGQAADYTQLPPETVATFDEENISDMRQLTDAQTGLFYQERLIIAYRNKIVASRTNYPLNMTRSFPYSEDSAIVTNVGSDFSRVLHLIESDGLVAFTTEGVYLHRGALGPSNLVFEKKGNWIIDEDVEPLAVPGGVFFVDKSTNTVRHLTYSTEYAAYAGEELSIFSDHLFNERKIKSWTYQDGRFPLIQVVFTDGTRASFTFEREHQMRAWTRGDGVLSTEYVASARSAISIETGETIDPFAIYVTKNSSGERFIEFSIDRYPKPSDILNNSEYDKLEQSMRADGVMSWSHLINDDLVTGSLSLTPVTPGEWDGDLTLASSGTGIFKSATLGAVGTVFRYFDADGYAYDLTVSARASDTSVTVDTDGVTFPSTAATNPRLYECRGTFDNDTDYDYFYELNDIKTDDTITVAPVTPSVWDGNLTISSVDDNIFPASGITELYYEKSDGTYITLTFVSRTNANEIVVTPSEEYPSSDATDPVIYTYRRRNFTLDHLEGEEVAILADNYVLASPFNDIEDYSTVSVSSGAITLPGSYKAAFLHVGRPIIADIETLDVNTVEQRPVLIESKTVNKLYIKDFKSRGFYIGNKYPTESDGEYLDGTDEETLRAVDLSDISLLEEDEDSMILGNRADQPVSKRHEITLPGDWDSNGRIAIRQVDPIHFEILSIILDIDDERRYDREVG